MAKEETRKHGPITEYRPDQDDVSGGSDHSVQSEALGAEGAADLSNTSASSGGAAGRTNTIDHPPVPKRSGKPDPGNRGGLTR